MKQTISELKDIAKAIQEPDFDRVLVACHRSPDGDACGSAYALAYALEQLGKKATVFCPDPFGADFSFITQHRFSQFEPKHFVTVDTASPEMLANALFCSNLSLVIDHHRISSLEGRLKFVDASAASCAEIILDLILLLGVKIDPYLAKCLYTAFATDTGSFRYSNTTARTFRGAALLAQAADEGELYRINKLLFETKSHKRMLLEAYAAEHMVFLHEGCAAYLVLDRKEQARLGANYEDLDPLISVIRQARGVRVAFVVKEREEGEYKVSVRAERGFDASEFCRAFGGGGHIAAAGCTLFGDRDTVVKTLIAALEKELS